MIGKILLTGAVCVFALPFVHPLGPVKQQRSQATLPDMPLIETSCRNCHSERTVRPWYSYLPGVGRRLEKDVAEARTHMNLSRRDRYSIDEKKDQLTRIAAEVRSRQMPPARYTILHPRARLSDIEIQTIYDWTMIQRRNLRSQGIKQSPQESILMPQ